MTVPNILKDAHKRWIWVLVFAIAFAWVESAVVVYLRKIFFDGSFSFPLIINWEAGKRVVDPWYASSSAAKSPPSLCWLP